MKTQISGGRCGCCQRQLKPFTILLPVGATGRSPLQSDGSVHIKMLYKEQTMNYKKKQD